MLARNRRRDIFICAHLGEHSKGDLDDFAGLDHHAITQSLYALMPSRLMTLLLVICSNDHLFVSCGNKCSC